MNNLLKTVTIGALLHDIGKILFRGRDLDGRAHSISGTECLKNYTNNKEILDCVRFHHHQDIKDAKLSRDSLAYIVYIADNISSGMDRRDIEGQGASGFDKQRLQESIYNLLNKSFRQDVYPVSTISESIQYPTEKNPAYDTASSYNEIFFGMSEGLKGINFEGEYLNSLLELCEAYLSFVPSSTFLGEVSDISLFDHSKVTASLAACILSYLSSQERNDFAYELFTNRQEFYQEEAFCLFSCDISGIQQYIYTISSKGALKGLRARSFYLEILLENLLDEILNAASLSRANLLYSGGGHAYMLLPNTNEVKKMAADTVVNTNRRLQAHFGLSLFIAFGMQTCSANELMSNTGNPDSYRNIFRSVASQISEMKLRRYSAAEIKQLNNKPLEDAGRECSICGVSAELEERPEGTICQNCAALADVSNLLIKPETVLLVLKEKMEGTALPLFSYQGESQYLYTLTVAKVKQILKDNPEKVVRIYSKNTFRTGLNLTTKLWMGDYTVRNPAGNLKTFAELAANSRGIERIGVLRADVDDMGAAFVSGFIRETDNVKDYSYLTLSRTATLSRSLSIFFKYYLNDLLANGQESVLAGKGKRNVVVVYSGGDDLFIVGAWNEVLSAALDIRRAFARYTGNSLTISAGFAVFEPSYPIARMAAETAELENAAKDYIYPNGRKNAISLFGREIHNEQLVTRHSYDWNTFEDLVLKEKYTLLANLLDSSEDYGNSFLYDILALLREAENHTINLARLAYVLARREPPPSAADEFKKTYAEFARKIYEWAKNSEERRQLMTAIIMYSYSRREKKEDGNNG